MSKDHTKKCAGCGKTLIEKDGYAVENTYGDKDLNIDGKNDNLWCEKCYEPRKSETESVDEPKDESDLDVESLFPFYSW